MDDTFARVVEGWHDFYVVAGTAAATLVGLLFVSITLRLDREADDETDIRGLGFRSFYSFVYALAFSLILLTPRPVAWHLGAAVCATGIFGLSYTIRHTAPYLRRPANDLRRRLLQRFAFQAFVLLLAAASGVGIGLDFRPAFVSAALAVVGLIIFGGESAWILLTEMPRK